MALTAGAPAPRLVRALETAGWGPLAGEQLRGVCSVLGALARRLPERAGQGLVTVDQVAVAAGYTRRWTSTRLALLEELDIIEWTRGGVVDGRPVPSYVRINKRVLLALVQIARQLRDDALAAQRAVTRARIAGLRRVLGQRRPVKSQVSPCGTEFPPSPYRGGPGAARAPDPPPKPTAERRRWIQTARANVAATRGMHR